MLYCCPADHGPLAPLTSQLNGSLQCQRCAARYELTSDGVVLLDVVNSAEALAFDEQQHGKTSLRPEEISTSSRLAKRFLAVTGATEISRTAKLLDVGCGKGELTIGLALATNAEIYAFDHSAESLRVLAATADGLGLRDQIQLSTQDANALAIARDSFDFVFGNAILHHILDWRTLVANLVRCLKIDGKATFAEPFLDGYFPVMITLKMAIRDYRRKHDESIPDNTGLLDFIIQNIGERTKYRNDVAVLSKLTDKHLFTIGDMVDFAPRIHCRVNLQDYEDKSFAKGMLEEVLKAYGIGNAEIKQSAQEIFGELTDYLGDEYGNIFSHFKFITFTREAA